MYPIVYADVLAARARLRPFFDPSPVRHYPQLDELVGYGIRVLVKHENHLPTGSFKVRNGTASITALSPEAAARGVIAATTGNHGLGLAWAGAQRRVSVTICVPKGNNPEKNAVIRSLGATLLEVGDRYDETVVACRELAEREGRTLIHSTNHREVIRPALQLYAVQSAGAPAQHDAYRDGQPRAGVPVATFAEGVATGSTYELTAGALRHALADFVLASDNAIAQAVRDLWRITHNLAEGAGAAGLAGLRLLAPRLAGRTVGIVMCGGNLDAARAVEVLSGGTPT